ncbi:hypothetical protein ABZX90_37015 [Streptomyces sp. NPDC002935]|uniref:hypothetical protein n=1 Tax=Streptomyces sp. NPDC002935 TaxID=3154545 RepID=UPI0033B96E1C
MPTASTPAEQSISVTLSAEVLVDLDDGRPTLVAATESNLGDIRETSPARLRDMVNAAHAQLDQIERLADEYEAAATLRAIVAEHHLTIEEWDTTTLDPFLRDRLMCWRMTGEDGSTLIIVPAGQDPIERVNFVAHLLKHLQAQA